MHLNLLAVSLLALSLSLPVMAADIVIDESGGSPTSDGDSGSKGEDGFVRNTASYDGAGAFVGSDGTQGDEGGVGGTGKAGEAGAVVTVTTDAPVGTISIDANGGNGSKGGQGGAGGRGGNGSYSPGFTDGIRAVGGKGGKGGDAGVGGAGGQGGDGGTIILSVNDAVGGDVTLSAIAGNGGEGGDGGQGGAGGTGGDSRAFAAMSTSGNGGDGGNGAIGGAGGARGPEPVAYDGGSVAYGVAGAAGQSDPDAYRGADGDAGAGGTIIVAINAAVGGDVNADAGTGTIRVTLNTGASVGGTITANEEATSALRFAMSIKDRSEYNAAKAYLGDSANAISGSITINGEAYSWTGFDQRIAALNFAGISTYNPGMDRRSYLSCSPRAVTAFHKDGAIQLVASRTSERGAFRIGTLTGNSFASQNDAGWSVAFDAAASGLRFNVLNAAGDTLATCRG